MNGFGVRMITNSSRWRRKEKLATSSLRLCVSSVNPPSSLHQRAFGPTQTCKPIRRAGNTPGRFLNAPVCDLLSVLVSTALPAGFSAARFAATLARAAAARASSTALLPAAPARVRLTASAAARSLALLLFLFFSNHHTLRLRNEKQKAVGSWQLAARMDFRFTANCLLPSILPNPQLLLFSLYLFSHSLVLFERWQSLGDEGFQVSVLCIFGLVLKCFDILVVILNHRAHVLFIECRAR